MHSSRMQIWHVLHLRDAVDLYIHMVHGVAWIEDGTTGLIHSCHPYIDGSSCLAVMHILKGWGPDDRTVESNGLLFNIDRYVVRDELDRIAAGWCICLGSHPPQDNKDDKKGAL